MSQYNQTKCLIIIAMNKIDFDNLLEGIIHYELQIEL